MRIWRISSVAVGALVLCIAGAVPALGASGSTTSEIVIDSYHSSLTVHLSKAVPTATADQMKSTLKQALQVNSTAAGPSGGEFLVCDEVHSFSDSDGTYTIRHPCGGTTGSWSYQISPGVCSFVISNVDETGMIWTRNGTMQGMQAPHDEGCRYFFHGTYNPEQDFDSIAYIDDFTFTVDIGGNVGSADIQIDGSFYSAGRGTSPSIAAVAGSGYVEAFQNPQGYLCNRTESGVSNCTNLPMMAATSPSITGLAGGGYVEAYQNPQGYLCNRLETGTQACTNLQMAPGTSPSIAGTTNGGYTEAFQASTGILWNRNSAGTAATTTLGMDPGSSPSISALTGGGYAEAFQNPQHNLCNRLETGTWACTTLGMRPGTSPSIAGTTNGGYTEAFQASTGILWNRNSAGTAASTGLGMM
jgi:hypothetical protein